MQPEDAEIAYLYRHEKQSIREIARRFNIGIATVSRALRRTGTESRAGGPSAERLDRAEVARVFEEQGRSVSKTAKHFDVPQFYIRRSLIRSGNYKPQQLKSVTQLDKWHRNGSEDFRNEVATLHGTGVSKAEIARRLDTTVETVDYALYITEANSGR